MVTLPSGLPEQVGDDEILSRFLTQSNQFNSVMPKPAAFLPNPVHRNTSVFRIEVEKEALQEIWNTTATGDRILKAVAFVKSRDVRSARLEVMSEEPPPAHANLEKWPWLEEDPDLQKAKQKEIATQIASKSTLLNF